MNFTIATFQEENKNAASEIARNVYKGATAATNDLTGGQYAVLQG